MPNAGDELHHFGWNACSSCLGPNAPRPHAERRYLVVPGLRSSRIHILDTKTDPRKPKIVKVIEPTDVADRAGYTRPHTVHGGPRAPTWWLSATGRAKGQAASSSWTTRLRRAGTVADGSLEIGPDGKRVYFTNSLYGAIDPQFYPEGIEGWMVKLDAGPAGGIAIDETFFC